MARIRTVKPEFWTSQQIVECSTNARLLFIGLWNFCDDRGVHPLCLRSLKMKVFPGDDFSLVQIQGWFNELLNQGLIRVFSDGKNQYFHVTGWHHQRIDRPSCKFPDPGEFAECSPSNRGGLVDGHPPERKGKDVEGDTSPSVAAKMPKTKPRRYEYTEAFEEIWVAYPKSRRRKKPEAYREFVSASIRLLSEREGWDPLEVDEFLVHRVQQFAQSHAGQHYAPEPARWFRDSRYDDSDESWAAYDANSASSGASPFTVVHAAVKRLWSPDLKNFDEVREAIGVSSWFEAAKKTGLSRICNSKADDRVLSREFTGHLSAMGGGV